MATDGALTANAETAQEIAPALLRFQKYVPEAATKVSALVSELYAISAALLELKTASSEPRNYRNRNLIDEDKYIVLRSLEYTFKDVNHFLRDLESRIYRSYHEAYMVVWIKIDTHFRNESNNSLLVRLGYYKHFLNDLTPIVLGRRPSPNIDVLFERIDRLLSVQDDRLAQDLENLALGTPRVRSWERVRGRPTASPGAASNGRRGGGGGGGAAGPSGGRTRYPSPHSPIFPESPPFVPEPPIYIPTSPSVTTTSTTTTGTASTPPSSAGSGMCDHWLPIVFAQSRPTTVFQTTGAESRCYGEHTSGATRKLRPGYDELLKVRFESGGLEIRLYSRDKDRKARILCQEDRNGRRTTSCEAITSLRILRKDSCLQLCKPDCCRRMKLWSNLRFPSYERLALFYCTLLSLKSQDKANPMTLLDDHVLPGESAPFSAVIIDDNFPHVLQILKDTDSGGMRLQASVFRGPMKRAPVWTAFINYRIASRAWVRKVETKKVHIGDLQRYIFSPDYTPEFGPSGEHELCFLKPRHAQRFMDVIDDLAKGRI